MPLNFDKCLFLQVGTKNKRSDHEMCGVKLKSVQCIKGLGVKIALNLSSPISVLKWRINLK